MNQALLILDELLAQAPFYLNNTERGRVGFPRLSNRLCERQRC